MFKRSIVIACVIVGSMQVAGAQETEPKYAPSTLDDSAFISELQRRGLHDLVQHLVNRGDVKDPIGVKRLNVAIAIARYEEGIKSEDAEARTAAVRSLDEALDLMKDLINSAPNHRERPVWQTDYAERVVTKWAVAPGAGRAEVFYDLGIPTADQRKLIEDHAAEAYVFLDQADAAFRKFEDQILNDEAFRKEMEFSGQTARMLEEYWRGRTPYFLGQMAYLTARLPDDHAYYKSLGEGKVRMQKVTPAEERKRLLTEASNRLTRMISENSNLRGAVKDRANEMIGRALLRNEKYDESLKKFEKLIERGTDDYVDLLARMGRSWVLHKKNQTTAAVAQLDRLATHQFVVAEGGVVLPLLIADTSHKIRLDAADQLKGDDKRLAIEKAYQPYFDLLGVLRKDDEITDAQVAGLENFIFRRWADAIGDRDLRDVPAAVVLGIGIAARQEGGQLIAKSFEARAEGNADQAGQFNFQAKPHLEKAIETLDKLLLRSDLIDSVSAKAMYNLGVARHFLHYGDSKEELEAANLLSTCAETYPGESDAEQAIKVAVEIAVRYFQMPQAIEGAEAAMIRALNVLFEQYPTSDYADEMRLIYGRDVLAPAGQKKQAVAVLRNVPFGHETYFDANRDALYILETLIEETDDDAARRELIETMRGTAERIAGEGLAAASKASGEDIAVVLEARESGDPERMAAAEALPAAAAATAYVAAATGRIMQAHAAALQGSADDGVELLKDFETEFAASHDQISQAMSKRVEVFIAADRVSDAAAEAERMMNKFPDRAIEDISRVLDKLDRQITLLRDKAEETRIIADAARLKSDAQTRAKAASRMAIGLADRAVAVNLPSSDIRYYKLLVVKTARIAGDLDTSLELARDLAKHDDEDADIAFELMETLAAYGLKNPTSEKSKLVEAFQLCSALIETYDNKEANGKWPERYWIAWLRLFEIMDAVGHNTADIPVRIRFLRERRDNNLGGEPYKSKFLRLQNKYGGN